MHLPGTILTCLMGAFASACVSDAGSQPPPAPPAMDAGLADVVRAARADAAHRTGVAAEALALLGAESVTWSDGSLGCPQPGRAYTQALVPGYRVRLRGPAGEMDYHASARGALLLCPPGQAVNPVPGAGRI